MIILILFLLTTTFGISNFSGEKTEVHDFCASTFLSWCLGFPPLFLEDREAFD